MNWANTVFSYIFILFLVGSSGFAQSTDSVQARMEGDTVENILAAKDTVISIPSVGSDTLVLIVRTPSPFDVTEEAESEKTDLSEPPSISDVISIPNIFWALVFMAIGYLFIRIITNILETLAEKSAQYRITIKGIIPVFRIVAWLFILFVVIAGIFQPPIATVIAVTATVGIAVGFASQDILRNIFGGDCHTFRSTL